MVLLIYLELCHFWYWINFSKLVLMEGINIPRQRCVWVWEGMFFFIHTHMPLCLQGRARVQKRKRTLASLELAMAPTA